MIFAAEGFSRAPTEIGRLRRAIAAVLLAAALGSAFSSVAWAQTLPAIAEDTPYADARKMLMDLGYQPAPSADAEACDADSDARCYLERVACAGTGRGECIFAWRKDRTMIEVVTVGEVPVVSLVRCGDGC